MWCNVELKKRKATHTKNSPGSLDWRMARREIKSIKEVDTDMISTLSAFESVPAIISQTFSLQGSASIHTAGCGSAIDNAKECIQLTAALPSQAGSAFLHNKIMLDKHDGVAIDFAFKIANEHDGKADGADGMAFVVQSCAENVLGEGKSSEIISWSSFMAA